jgi:hypothetical protein
MKAILLPFLSLFFCHFVFAGINGGGYEGMTYLTVTVKGESVKSYNVGTVDLNGSIVATIDTSPIYCTEKDSVFITVFNSSSWEFMGTGADLGNAVLIHDTLISTGSDVNDGDDNTYKYTGNYFLPFPDRYILVNGVYKIPIIRGSRLGVPDIIPVNNIALPLELTLNSNGASQKLILNNGTDDIKNIMLFDISGRNLFNIPVENQTSVSVNMGNSTAGIYFIEAIGQKSKCTKEAFIY